MRYARLGLCLWIALSGTSCESVPADRSDAAVAPPTVAPPTVASLDPGTSARRALDFDLTREPARMGMEPAPTATGIYCAEFAVDDFDADGRADIACVSGPLAVAFQGPGGDFSEQVMLPSSPIPGGNVVTGDFNGDGRQDLAWIAGAVRVVLSGPGRSFGPALVFDAQRTIAQGDIDGDHLADLVMARTEFQQTGSIGRYTRTVYLSIVRGSSTGTMIPLPETVLTYEPDLGCPGSCSSVLGLLWLRVSLADLDGDGRLDLVVTGGPDNSYRLGAGDGTFGQPIQLPGDRPRVIADLDGDGRSDLITSEGNSPTYAGQQRLFLQGETGWTGFLVDDQSAWAMLSIDVGGGGHPSVLYLDQGCTSPWQSGCHQPYLFAVSGSATKIFGRRPRWSWPYDDAAKVIAHDMDGDGVKDLVVSSPQIEIVHAHFRAYEP